MHYRFTVVDTSENWGTSSWDHLTVSDNDPPVMGHILYPPVAYTGEDLEVKVEVSENVEISSVQISYHFGIQLEKKIKMKLVNGSYVYSIPIPENDLSYLHFTIIAFDKTGFKAESSEHSVEVIDGLPPVIDKIPDRTYYQGQTIEIKATGNDNIGIESIEWVGSPLLVVGDTMTGVIDQIGTFLIKVIMYDRGGNSNFTEFNLTILDEFHDRDNDNVWDLKEIELGLDPDNNDTDGDGMPDGWELSNGLDPKRSSANEDQDLDGLTDLEEYLLGTDPNIAEKDEKSFPWIVLIIAIGAAFLMLVLLAGLLFFIRSRRDMSDLGPSSSAPLPEQRNLLEEFLQEVDSAHFPQEPQPRAPENEQYTQNEQFPK
jgi:hypothetical protein